MSESEKTRATPGQAMAGAEKCATARDGTGTRCLCTFACSNYMLRAAGYKAEDPSWPRPAGVKRP
jgi:hypothetical protein